MFRSGKISSAQVNCANGNAPMPTPQPNSFTIYNNTQGNCDGVGAVYSNVVTGSCVTSGLFRASYKLVCYGSDADSDWRISMYPDSDTCMGKSRDVTSFHIPTGTCVSAPWSTIVVDCTGTVNPDPEASCFSAASTVLREDGSTVRCVGLYQGL